MNEKIAELRRRYEHDDGISPKVYRDIVELLDQLEQSEKALRHLRSRLSPMHGSPFFDELVATIDEALAQADSAPKPAQEPMPREMLRKGQRVGDGWNTHFETSVCGEMGCTPADSAKEEK